jgi:hypothetical protein
MQQKYLYNESLGNDCYFIKARFPLNEVTQNCFKILLIFFQTLLYINVIKLFLHVSSSTQISYVLGNISVSEITRYGMVIVWILFCARKIYHFDDSFTKSRLEFQNIGSFLLYIWFI